MTMALKCVDSAIFEKKNTNLIIVVLVYYNNFIIYTYYIRNRSTTWFDLLRSLKVSMANKKNRIQIIGIVKTMRARFFPTSLK